MQAFACLGCFSDRLLLSLFEIQLGQMAQCASTECYWSGEDVVLLHLTLWLREMKNTSWSTSDPSCIVCPNTCSYSYGRDSYSNFGRFAIFDVHCCKHVHNPSVK